MRCACFGASASPSCSEAWIRLLDCVTIPPLPSAAALPTKLRLALLHERGDALSCVLALEQRLHERALGLQALLQRPLDPTVHRELYGTYCLARASRELLGVPAGLLLQIVGWEEPVEDAQGVGLGGRDGPSGHHEVERLARPDQTRQALGAAVAREQSKGRLRQPEHVLALRPET